jgi:hypothetical protein
MSRLSVLVLALFAIVSLGGATGVVQSVLHTTGSMLVIDSAAQATPDFFPEPTPGWGGELNAYDTFNFAPTLSWPSAFRLWVHFAGQQLDPYDVSRPGRDSWVTLPWGRAPQPEIKFIWVTSGVEEVARPGNSLAVRAVQNPTAGPVRLTAELVAGVTPSVEVYSGAGVLVRNFDGLTWDRRDVSGKSVAAGLYLLRVNAGNGHGLIKVILTD